MRLYKAHFRKPYDWQPSMWGLGNGNSSLIEWLRWLNQTHPPVALETLGRVFEKFVKNGSVEPPLAQVRREYEHMTQRRPRAVRPACPPGERRATELEVRHMIDQWFPECRKLRLAREQQKENAPCPAT